MQSARRPGLCSIATVTRPALAWRSTFVPARFVWTRFCNSGCLSHGIGLTGFVG
jgi:hypothetical protein